jgi:hypothetical protein
MVRTQIQLHSEQIQWLKIYGLRKGISMAQVIRDSIDYYRLHNKRSEILNTKKKKALKAVGAFSTDTAKN